MDILFVTRNATSRSDVSVLRSLPGLGNRVCVFFLFFYLFETMKVNSLQWKLYIYFHIKHFSTFAYERPKWPMDGQPGHCSNGHTHRVPFNDEIAIIKKIVLTKSVMGPFVHLMAEWFAYHESGTVLIWATDSHAGNEWTWTLRPKWCVPSNGIDSLQGLTRLDSIDYNFTYIFIATVLLRTVTALGNGQKGVIFRCTDWPFDSRSNTPCLIKYEIFRKWSLFRYSYT